MLFPDHLPSIFCGALVGASSLWPLWMTVRMNECHMNFASSYKSICQMCETYEL